MRSVSDCRPRLRFTLRVRLIAARKRFKLKRGLLSDAGVESLPTGLLIVVRCHFALFSELATEVSVG